MHQHTKRIALSKRRPVYEAPIYSTPPPPAATGRAVGHKSLMDELDEIVRTDPVLSWVYPVSLTGFMFLALFVAWVLL